MRRLPSAALLVCLLAAPVTRAQFVCGDCNGDGAVNVIDAYAAAQHAAGLVYLWGDALDRCDIDASGAVQISDALRIARRIVGIDPVIVCLEDCLGPARDWSAGDTVGYQTYKLPGFAWDSHSVPDLGAPRQSGVSNRFGAAIHGRESTGKAHGDRRSSPTGTAQSRMCAVDCGAPRGVRSGRPLRGWRCGWVA